ncbi:MAG: hypothetical protein K6B39_04365 [Lachnospiraceae bacterium]|nr:hypothetical protein [Lachnospiraceae bacterium]
MEKKIARLMILFGILFCFAVSAGGCGAEEPVRRREPEKVEDSNKEVTAMSTPTAAPTHTPTPISIADEPRFEQLSEHEKEVLRLVADNNTVDAFITDVDSRNSFTQVKLTWNPERAEGNSTEFRQQYCYELAKTIGAAFPEKAYVTIYFVVKDPNKPEGYAFETWKGEWIVSEKHFDYDKLKNWNDAAINEEYGADGIRAFMPTNPNPRYFIVSAEEVIDPLTGKVSEGGHNHREHREYPISTNDLLQRVALFDNDADNRNLILTDDPNLATYVLILDFEYYDGGTFTYSDKTVIPEFDSRLIGTLRNMITGEEIVSKKKYSYSVYKGESVRKSMLENAKRKQLYGDAPHIYASDFEDYNGFIDRGP